MMRTKFTIDATREICFLVGSLLFIVGAVAIQIDASNKVSPPVYVACAVCYFLGSMVGIGYLSYLWWTNRDES